VLHQIGVGVLGPVFRTYEPVRDRLIAVKVFRLDVTPEQAQALADELARAADAGLFHPSIVEPVASGVEGTVAYRAEEYVAAESLDVAMRHYAPATLDKVLPFIRQLADAIDFARAAGIGHGALHPRDIFVTPDEARATGFGVVDALDRLSLRAPVRRPYSAPERVASDSWGAPADIFSLAAIAFELLTGRRPSGVGDQVGPLTGAVVTEHTSAIRDVLVRAMAEDPDERYSTARSFASALEAASRGENLAGASPVVAFSPVEAGPARPAPEEMAFASEDEAVEAGVPDDIAAERDEDEAHWQLSRAEAAAPSGGEGREALLFSDEGSTGNEGSAEESFAQERTAADAADILMIEPPVPEFADELRPSGEPEQPRAEHERPIEMPVMRPAAAEEPPVSPPRRAIIGEAVSLRGRSRPRPAPVVEPGILRLDGRATSHETAARESHGSQADRTRVVMLPLAIALMVGLLIGFAGGYVVGLREGTLEQAGNRQASTAPPDSGPKPQATTSSPQPTGREWSEQAVASPGAKPPAVARETPADGPVETRRPPVPAAAKSGKIVVRSTPSGADVTINDRPRGRTPLTVDEARFGNYSVRIALAGYETARQEFRLTPQDATRTLLIDLQRQRSASQSAKASSSPAPTSARAASTATSGSIFVDSRPRGARVLLDGKLVGTTPLRIPDVSIGSHAVRLELADHQPWTNNAQVTAGQEARVTGSLEPIR
jgi:eukaryotic-like serine/threonine-protein kinase